jgi:hypothetical protein
VSLKEKFVEGLKLYFLTLSLALAIVLLGSFVYATATRTLFFEVLRWPLLAAVFVMFLRGCGGLLPSSEYHYGSYSDPVAMREKFKAVVKGGDSKESGLAFVLVGFTLLLTYFVMFPS